jgi:hypothetical protein
MVYVSLYKGILFFEGYEASAITLEPIEYKKRCTFNAQLKTLDCVKEQLMEKTIALGGNAVVNFKYGQKSVGWFKSTFFNLDDDVRWYGSGVAAIIPEETRMEILARLDNV